MKTRIFIYTILAGLIISDLSLGKNPSDQTVTTLGEIRTLVDISQDLEDTAPVLIGENSRHAFDNKNCNCTCRDDQWACTDTNCNLQGHACATPQQVSQKDRDQ
jgi:hypothetical protein